VAVKALIFDCDGTLADTEEAHRAAFNQAFAEAGLDWHWSVARYRVLLDTTGGKERIARYIAEEDTSACDVAALHAAKNLIYARLAESGAVALRPGVTALMEVARQNDIALAIATTTSRRNLDALIAATPLRQFTFAAIICGEDVRRKKPDPEVYLLALEKLGLDAADCLAFEDSVSGLRSARAARIATVVTPNSYTIGSDFTGSVAVVNDLTDFQIESGAGEGIRTLDPNLGKVVLYP
jgi:HAD superfamily hydrolase (TIGR01509 family)